MAHDDLFKRPPVGDPVFRFDGAVADVFDDMIRRSIPGYEALVRLIAVAARRYARDDTVIYDLGCSLGTLTLAMRRAVQKRVAIVAIDESPAMIQRCERLIERDNSPVPVHVVCGDIAQHPIEHASLVVMNFTLQFMPTERRLELLRSIRSGLVPGGVLVLSEKLAFDTESRARLLQELHDDFRRANGYTDLEISRKRDALEQVLRCDTEEVQRRRLADAGFGQVEPWFRGLNFASWLAFAE